MARDYPIHLDFCATAPNREDIAEGMETTLKLLANARQMIAEAKDLITKVDRLLENDTLMRHSFLPVALIDNVPSKVWIKVKNPKAPAATRALTEHFERPKDSLDG